MSATAAQLLVRCLEDEGVQYVFGIPGEENIHFVQALADSEIRYVLVRHEQAASFMAEMYGRLTQRAAVCSATLGPGAINLQLGVADAQTNSTPLIAISAQVGRQRSYKESHQGIDLVPMFAPITKWSALVPTPESLPEIVRKAFKTAQTERPGAVYLAIPEDIEGAEVPDDLAPLRIDRVRPNEPTDAQVDRAVEILRGAQRPIVLAGHGAAREGASTSAQLIRFAEASGIPVATTFHGKGVFPDDHALGLGAVGFMRHDYVNFGFDAADVVIAVGYELQEFDPKKINPDGDARIVHLHHFPAEVDRHYPVDVGLHGSVGRSLELLSDALERANEASGERLPAPRETPDVARRLKAELDEHEADDRVPLSPQRIVADTRKALGREDIVLADTGAAKMWMARLYPTYAANTCLLSNGLSTMGFSLPGALGAKLAVGGRGSDRRILAATGDGAFLMHAQELETAVREEIPLCVLVWEDEGYGLIEWKMEMELGTSSSVKFGNPDVVAFTESFGGKGVRITAADQLLPALQEGLASDGVTVIAVPVDYAENLRLTERLGELEDPL